MWTGPCDPGPNGGVSQSMLSRFLNCRERFRLYAMEGLRPQPVFESRIEYGSMHHLCEEAYAAGQDWKEPLKAYVQALVKRYPMSRDEVLKWYNVCLVQFPLYIAYWANSSTEYEPVVQEEVFHVPYQLPNGRPVVYLRGKFDGVELITGDKGNKGVYLFETKTKGQIDRQRITRQLSFDLQTMLYLVALGNYQGNETLMHYIEEYGIHGVRYNVIKRPLSGGAGSIVRHKPSKKNPEGESEEEYYSRLSGIIHERSDEYFDRFISVVSEADVATFTNSFLIPILTQLCHWYDSVKLATYGGERDVVDMYGFNWRHPYGVYNILDEGGTSDLDNYLDTGSMVGLVHIDSLFNELKPQE